MTIKYEAVAYDLGKFTDSLDGEVYRIQMSYEPLDSQTVIYTAKEYVDPKLDSLEMVLIPNHKLDQLIKALLEIRIMASDSGTI